MIHYIAHRVNSIEELKEIPENIGVEIDLRDRENGEIYLNHDPFCGGEDFEKYIQFWGQRKQGILILNIKSERIEHEIKRILSKYHIDEYFFLDCSFPMVKRLSDQGERNIALRLSEWEGMDTICLMKGKVDWVWVDCFESFVLNRAKYQCLKKMGYKICFVSPELQGQQEKIEEYAREIKQIKVYPDAVCTKVRNIKIWREVLDE